MNDVNPFAVTAASPPEPAPGTPSCAICRQPVGDSYFKLAERMLCGPCSAQLNAGDRSGSFGRACKATLLGSGAALLGAAIWFAVRRLTGLEIGYIAILVGYLVGKAVLYGSAYRGGRGYQALAVVLTYVGIASNYVPDVLEGVFNVAHQRQAPNANAAGGPANTPEAAPPAVAQQPDLLAAFVSLVVLIVVVFSLALAMPFLAGFQNVIGILIIGFALWEAWKFTARRTLPITGPYSLAPSSGFSAGA